MERPKRVRPREVYLMGNIDEASLGVIGGRILEYFAEDQRKPVILMLCSGGGRFKPALAFYEFMRHKRIPLEVNAYAEASSAALILLSLGKVRRASPSSTFYFHKIGQGSDSTYDVTDARNMVRSLDHSTDFFTRIVSGAMGVKAEKVRKLMEEERLLTAKEAKEIGLVNEILDICY